MRHWVWGAVSLLGCSQGWTGEGTVIKKANAYCLDEIRNVHCLPSSSPQPWESHSQPILATRKLRAQKQSWAQTQICRRQGGCRGE